MRSTDDVGKGLILIAEDEPAIADLLRLYLEREGFQVHVEADGQAALDAVRARRPAAIILDIGVPTVDGIEICRALRGAGDWTPILFVTARYDEVDRIVGLELGADDYVTKPFSPREVVARVRTVLRRAERRPGPGPDAGAVHVVGDVTLDEAGRRVTVADQEITLTTTEFDLLAHLMRHPGLVFPREQLLAEVWGYRSLVTTRTVDVHVAQLRAKLGPACPIRTVRGVGYGIDDRK